MTRVKGVRKCVIPMTLCHINSLNRVSCFDYSDVSVLMLGPDRPEMFVNKKKGNVESKFRETVQIYDMFVFLGPENNNATKTET